MMNPVEQYESKRYLNELIRSQLDIERSSFFSHWSDLGTYIMPRRPRFVISDVNRGDRRNQAIIDSTATFAARTLASGMMSGVTSPARPWFRLSTPTPGMMENAGVKLWLYEVGNIMSTVFLRSNLYNVLPIIYGDMGTFGTACMFVEEDFDGDVMRFYPFAIGEYMISNNDKLKVDCFVREFQMTVRQIVKKFGKFGPDGKIESWDNFSLNIQNLWEQGQREAWIDLVHIVKENEHYDPRKLEAKYKKYVSCYYERGSDGSSQDTTFQDRLLRESGYDYFPVLAPRWEVNGEDAYGTNCPGMIALGDVKQLQLGERRMMQAIEKMVNPPMVAPTSMRQSKTSILPGDITYADTRDGQGGFRPAHEVNPRVQELAYKQQEVQKRIQRAYFEDLFLMLASSNRREITAREIEERHEEKLLALGPVLEQLNQDLLDPLIDITFQICLRQNLFPPAPKELEGMDLKVEYISVMAQAQKLVGIAGLERFAGFAQGVIAADPTGQTLDKVDLDQMLDVYADAVSIAPNIVRSDDAVAEIRAGRQQAQAQQAKAQQFYEGAKAAKNLAGASVDPQSPNALTRMIEQANANKLVDV
jgi:Bacteriophage head to tail connecting protein